MRKFLYVSLLYCFFFFSCCPCIANELSYQTKNDEYHESSYNENTFPSVHILIVTTGRVTLIHMLQSLQPQLQHQDFLTVVFDGRDDAGVYGLVEDYLTEFKCNCSIWMEPINTGFWGHVLHNKYNQLPGNFILHADDDDTYTSDAMDAIRHYCIDSQTLYIFKMQFSDGRTLWQRPVIEINRIGKPMGAIPSKYNSQGVWGYSYTGDFDFYNSLQAVVPKIEFIDHVIYSIRPNQ